jgi:hypothetical protein
MLSYQKFDLFNEVYITKDMQISFIAEDSRVFSLYFEM